MYNYNDCLLKDGSIVSCVKLMFYFVRFIVRFVIVVFWNEIIIVCLSVNVSVILIIVIIFVWFVIFGWGLCLFLFIVWDSFGLYSENFYFIILCVFVFYWFFFCLECWIFILLLYVYLFWFLFFFGWLLYFFWYGILSILFIILLFMKEGIIYIYIILVWGRIFDIFLVVSGIFVGCFFGFFFFFLGDGMSFLILVNFENLKD